MLWWFAQTTLIAGALAVFATLAGRWKRLGPEVRHALWLIVLIKLALPPVVAWPWRVPDRWPSKVEPAPVARPLKSSPPTVVAVTPPSPPPHLPSQPSPPLIIEPPSVVFEPLPSPRVELEPPPRPSLPPSPEEVVEHARARAEIRLQEPEFPERIEPIRQSEPVAMVPEVESPVLERKPPIAESVASQPTPKIDKSPWEIANRRFRIGNLPALMIGLWVVGSLIVVIRRWVKIVRFQRSLSGSIPAPDWLVEETRTISDRVGVRPPPVVMTPKVLTPLLWCLGLPRLILPEPLVKRLDADRWPGILAHELAHLARFDHWVVRLELLVEAVWWWNPLFWHVQRKLHEEAELACDARVIRTLPDCRIAYAEALVDVCEHLARASIASPALGVGGAGASRSLEGRLLMILRDPIPSRPSRRAALGATLLAALALPAWTLGQQQEPEKPKAETPSKVEATPSKPGEPQPIPPDVKISPEAADATVPTIQQAQAKKAADLQNLSFRYLVASRERGLQTIPGHELKFQGLGQGIGMSGTGEMMSIQSSPSTLVRVEAADVFLAFGENGKISSRVDFFEARRAEQPQVGPQGKFEWDRRFVAKDGASTMALGMPWDSKGAVPFRWLNVPSSDPTYGDSLARWMSGAGSSVNPDDSLDPLDPRPENLLDLTGSTKFLLMFDNVARPEVAGVDLIDGREAVRVAWIGNQGTLRGICWYVPKLGYALVRLDATLDPQMTFVPLRGRMTWRRRASQFVQVGDHWLPGQVTFEETEADLNGGEPVYHKELTATFENFRQVEAPPANAFRPKMAVQGLDDKTGQFTALPPEIPAGLIDRLKKAVQESPFGLPSAVADAPVAGLSLPGYVAPQPAAAQVPMTGQLPTIIPPAQPNGADPAKADPGIVVPPDPGFKDPIPVVDPKGNPIPLKSPEDRVAIDRAIEIRFKADPEVEALAEQIIQAEEKVTKVNRITRIADDPAVKRAQQGLDELKTRYNKLYELKSTQFRKTIERETAEARDAIDLLVTRRDRKAADLRKAEAQKRQASVTNGNTQKLRKQNAVSQSEADLAESDLAAAEAEVDSKKADLAEAELLINQAKRRLEESQATALDRITKAPTVGSKPASVEVPNEKPAEVATPADPDALAILQVRRDAKAGELAKAKAQKSLAEAVVTRNQRLVGRNPNLISLEERLKAEAELGVADAQVSTRTAELDEAEIVLNRAKENANLARPTAKLAEPEVVPPAATLSDLNSLRDAVELAEIQLQAKQFDFASAGSRADSNRRKIDVAEQEVRLKQAKRRVEAEVARLKRDAERAKSRLDWSEGMFKKGYVSYETYLADRKAYDDLMLLIDPNYVAPPADPRAAGPKPEAAPKPVLAVKLTGEKFLLSGRKGTYKIQVSNNDGIVAEDVKVVASLPKEGGKLDALPVGSKFVAASRKLTWTIPKLQPGKSITLTFTYQANTPGVYLSSVGVGFDQDIQVSATCSTEVPPLELQVNQPAKVIDVGKTHIYDITIKNIGVHEVTRVQLDGKLTKNLKLIKSFNVNPGKVKFNSNLGEFTFPEVDRLKPGETLTLSLEVEATEAGTGGCHLFLGHAGMQPGDPMIEEAVVTSVTKPVQPPPIPDEPKK